MTDARFPERWLSDARLQRVSPEAYRAHGNALMWSVSNRTDGAIPVWALPMVPHLTEAHARELASAGLWAGSARDGWMILDYDDTQTTAAQLAAAAAARRADKIRQRRHRAHVAGDHSLCGDRTCTNATVTRDITGDVTVESTRTGQARPGQAVRGPGNSANGDGHSCADCGRPVSLLAAAQTGTRLGRPLCSACSVSAFVPRAVTARDLS